MSTRRRRITRSIPLTNKKNASVCNWDHIEETLEKSIFIQGMNNQQIQIDLLSEERTPSETLQNKLARERGQERLQKMINTNINANTSNPWFEKKTIYKTTKQSTYSPNTPVRTNTRLPSCGNKFFPRHLNVCPLKNEACRICKKIGHFAKLYKSEMAPQPQYNMQQRCQRNYSGQQSYSGHQQQNGDNQLVTRKTPQRMRNINEEESEDTHDTSEETRDPESEFCMQNMQKDWPFRQTLQIRNGPTTTIQYATKMPTKLLRSTKLLRPLTTKRR